MRPPLLTTPRAPYDRYHARHSGVGGSAGGPPRPAGMGHAIEPGVIDAMVREGPGINGGTTINRLILRDRMPWYDRDYMVGNDNTLVDWTRSGPIRPSLHNRQMTLTKQVGTDGTRNFDPRPIRSYGMQDQGHGMHTNPEPTKKRTNARYRSGNPQMQPTRIGRLSSSVYTGQSYSQTTRIQGG